MIQNLVPPFFHNNCNDINIPIKFENESLKSTKEDFVKNNNKTWKMKNNGHNTETTQNSNLNQQQINYNNKKEKEIENDNENSFPFSFLLSQNNILFIEIILASKEKKYYQICHEKILKLSMCSYNIPSIKLFFRDFMLMVTSTVNILYDTHGIIDINQILRLNKYKNKRNTNYPENITTTKSKDNKNLLIQDYLKL